MRDLAFFDMAACLDDLEPANLSSVRGAADGVLDRILNTLPEEPATWT
jgi:hypothetical protein